MSKRWMIFFVVGGIAIGSALVWFAVKPPDDPRSHIVAVAVPELTAVGRRGERLFYEKCAACHGENAGGSVNGPPLVHVIYEPGHHADVAFRLAAMHGVRQHHWRFGSMAAVEGVSKDDVEAITAYVRELQRNNDIR